MIVKKKEEFQSKNQSKTHLSPARILLFSTLHSQLLFWTHLHHLFFHFYRLFLLFFFLFPPRAVKAFINYCPRAKVRTKNKQRLRSKSGIYTIKRRGGREKKKLDHRGKQTSHISAYCFFLLVESLPLSFSLQTFFDDSTPSTVQPLNSSLPPRQTVPISVYTFTCLGEKYITRSGASIWRIHCRGNAVHEYRDSVRDFCKRGFSLPEAARLCQKRESIRRWTTLN